MGSMFENTIFNQDVSKFDTSSVTNMRHMFIFARDFDQDISSFDLSSVTDMAMMFEAASSFNQNLCSWQDNFPYTAFTYHIFTDSGCTYQDTPNETLKGPFCASNSQ